eukprot:TRINITY_DN5798_c0_g1_i3.p1 TRINITY_DN5798_c0_g1~~TRINITY_DN5798_c0_g1_i3.p1  ORF type:complete len:941 (+),score=280.55 TRINITY_DN5798_c0_g1_i3:461-3283(+)
MEECALGVVLFDFEAVEGKELNVKKGQKVAVLHRMDDWTKVQVVNTTTTGWIPTTFVQIIPPKPPKTVRSPPTHPTLGRSDPVSRRNQDAARIQRAQTATTLRKNINRKDTLIPSFNAMGFKAPFKELVEDATLEQVIQHLLGQTKEHFPSDEIQAFRSRYLPSCKMYSAKNKVKRHNFGHRYAPSVNYRVDDLSTPLPEEFPMLFNYPNNYQKSIPCRGKWTVKEALSEVFRCTHASLIPMGMTPSTVILKVVGFSEYIQEGIQLENIEHIRECLRKNTTIEFLIISKTQDLLNVLGHPRQKFSWLNMEPADTSQQDSISHLSVTESFELQVRRIRNLPENLDYSGNGRIWIEGGVYHGNVLLHPIMVSTPFNSTEEDMDCQAVLRSEKLGVWQIPMGSKLCLTVYYSKAKQMNRGTPLGWVSSHLIDFRRNFTTGKKDLRLWPNEKANPLAMCVENVREVAPVTITVDFTCFSKYYPTPVSFTPLITEEEALKYDPMSIPPVPSEETLEVLSFIKNADPLFEMSAAQKEKVWENRFFLKNNASSLSKVLQSITWSTPPWVAECLRALHYWRALEPINALELLDSRFPCPEVRAYAVKSMHSLSDKELGNYCLQLVQALQYEPYHDSPLARFLLERALENIEEIGITFFWTIKAQMHKAEVQERYGLLLEAFLWGCGAEISWVFQRQNSALRKLLEIAEEIKLNFNLNKEKKNRLLREKLAEISLSFPIHSPLNSQIQFSALLVDQCRVMDSAKLPLWLVFQNSCSLAGPTQILLKSGDDLRQDMLTMQMFRIMDTEWKNNGIELGMSPYGCLATGDQEGILEIVPNSKTISGIQKELGVNAVFKETSLANWLMENNPFILQEQCSQNFVLSCAAYCVATYVLGIGDRHNDNIMVSRCGHLFHIDFGHFLGNVKTWAGINRERAPFVLTKDFAYGKSST